MLQLDTTTWFTLSFFKDVTLQTTKQNEILKSINI